MSNIILKIDYLTQGTKLKFFVQNNHICPGIILPENFLDPDVYDTQSRTFIIGKYFRTTISRISNLD